MRLETGTAGTAEAGVIFIATELGLQDQITVGQLRLVDALPARVPRLGGQCRRDHLHLGTAADCLASTVGTARVGALIPGPQVVDQQCAIGGLVDTVAISPYRQPIPGGERMLGELSRASSLQALGDRGRR